MFAVGIYRAKHGVNLGTLWRSAEAFGASLFITIGSRVERQCSDTTKAILRTPLISYESWESFLENRPWNIPIVGVEIDDNAVSLPRFIHPPRALYLLGAEDDGIPPRIRKQLQRIVHIPGGNFNVATAGSIVMYDRIAKCSLITPYLARSMHHDIETHSRHLCISDELWPVIMDSFH